MKTEFENRLSDHDTNTCWQYDIRIKNKNEDVILSGFSKEELDNLKVSDFAFAFEKKEEIFTEIKLFIERHEWLGRLSLYPTQFLYG